MGENLSPELKEYGKWLLSEAYSQTNLVFAAKVKEITDPLFAKIDELSAQVVAFASLIDAKVTIKQSTTEQAIYDEHFPSLPVNDSGWVTVRKGRKMSTPTAAASFAHTARFAAIQASEEIHMKEEKRKNAVIVGLSEAKTDDETARNDKNIIDQVFVAANIDGKKKVRIARYGQKHPNKARILKVHTDLEEMRDKVLRAFRDHRPADMKKSAYIRKDFTPTELEQDRICKATCFERNTTEGKRRWLVRDLHVIEARKPWEEFKITKPTNQLPMAKMNVSEPQSQFLEEGET